MKKLLTLIATLFVCGIAVAQQFRSSDFLCGNVAVFLTNNATVAYGDANVGYSNATSQAVYSGTSQYSTNGFITPGNWQTNSGVTYGNAWCDLASFCNARGDAGVGSIFVSIVGTAARSTNTVTFEFRRLGIQSSAGVPSLECTQADSKFIFALTGNGTTVINCMTNLPAALMTGAAGFRLHSIITADNAAATGYQLQACTLNGFK